MTAPAPVPEEAPAPRGRALALGATALALLALPFLVFGGMMLELKARVELRCEPGGPCTLHHLGWLTAQQVERFGLEELQGASVERNRSNRPGAEPLYRPVLDTARGRFALSYRWLEEPAQAERTAQAVNRFRAQPQAGKPFTLFHDHRRTPARVGGAFSAVGLGLLGASVWLALKARRQARAERPTA